MTPRVRRWRALDLCRLNEEPCRYLFRRHGEDDNAWKLVLTSPICEMDRPQGGTYLQVVTVKFAVGEVELFDPDDQVETRAE